MHRWLFLCIILLSLASCGFKPRGDVPLAQPLHRLYLQTSDPYGQLTRNIKQALKSYGVHLANAANEADTTLEILSETTSQQLLSVGGTQQTRQYNLILTVTFQLSDSHGRVTVPPQTVSENRTIPISSNQILGGSNETTNLYQQMRQAIVYTMINRLASQEITQILMKKP